MTADTPPSELVERLRKSAARREWGNDYKEQLHVEAADTIAALIHDNARYIETNASLATENATLLRERDAQAKVIADMQSAILKQAADLVTGKYLPNLPEGKPLGYRQVTRCLDDAAEQHRLAAIALRNVYDTARAGLNTQGSGNG